MILTRLREETGRLHVEVELAVGLPSRLRSTFAYADLLARFYGLHAPLEMQLARTKGHEELGLRLPERSRSALLLDDLTTLGWSSCDVESISRCPESLGAQSLARALGCLYVLEGSTLGGSVICRAVQQRFGSSRACKFFAGYGDRTGMMWNEFCDVLKLYSESNPHCDDEIVAAASATFQIFRNWLLETPSCTSEPVQQLR